MSGTNKDLNTIDTITKIAIIESKFVICISLLTVSDKSLVSAASPVTLAFLSYSLAMLITSSICLFASSVANS